MKKRNSHKKIKIKRSVHGAYLKRTKKNKKQEKPFFSVSLVFKVLILSGFIKLIACDFKFFSFLFFFLIKFLISNHQVHLIPPFVNVEGSL